MGKPVMYKGTAKSLSEQIKMHVLFHLDPVPGAGRGYSGRENADLNSLLLHSTVIRQEMGRAWDHTP